MSLLCLTSVGKCRLALFLLIHELLLCELICNLKSTKWFVIFKSSLPLCSSPPRLLRCHDERGGGGPQRRNTNSNSTVSGGILRGNSSHSRGRRQWCRHFLLPPPALPAPPPTSRGKGGERGGDRSGRDYSGREDREGGGGVRGGWRGWWWRWQQWYQRVSCALPWAGTCGLLLPQADDLSSQLVHPHGLQPISFKHCDQIIN